MRGNGYAAISIGYCLIDNKLCMRAAMTRPSAFRRFQLVNQSHSRQRCPSLGVNHSHLQRACGRGLNSAHAYCQEQEMDRKASKPHDPLSHASMMKSKNAGPQISHTF